MSKTGLYWNGTQLSHSPQYVVNYGELNRSMERSSKIVCHFQAHKTVKFLLLFKEQLLYSCDI